MVDNELKEARGIAPEGPHVFHELVSLAEGLISALGVENEGPRKTKPTPVRKQKRTRPFRGRQYSPERRQKVIRALAGTTSPVRLGDLVKLTGIPKNSLKDLLECLIVQGQVCKTWKGQFWVFGLDPQADLHRIECELRALDPGNLIADFNQWRQSTRKNKLLPRRLAERIEARLEFETLKSLAMRLYVSPKTLNRLVADSLIIDPPPVEEVEAFEPVSLEVDRPTDLDPLWRELTTWRATRANRNDKILPHIARMLVLAMGRYRKSVLYRKLGVGYALMAKVQADAAQAEPAETPGAESEAERLVTLALPAAIASEVLAEIRNRFGLEMPVFFPPVHGCPPGVKSNVSPV